MKVGIVGMGAAGIHAARLLQNAGADVECFEARDRIGGRLHTVTGPNGMRIDAGGEWIDADHQRVLALANELDVELDCNPRPPGRVYYRGDWAPEDQLWRAVIGDETRFENRAEELARNLPEVAGRLAGRTLQSLIEETAQTETGKFWLAARLRSDEGEDPVFIGLVGWLDFYRKYLDREEPGMSAFRISGGLGSLMESAAQGLPIKFGSILRSVDNGVEHAVLRFGDEVREVDHVVLALPISTLANVSSATPTPADLLRARQGIRMGRAIKAVLYFQNAWWLAYGWSGSLHSDGFLQQVWAAPNAQPALGVYICGNQAESLARMSNPVQVLAQELFRVFPVAIDSYIGGKLFDWNSEPNSMGGFPYSTVFDPGNAWQRASRPHGRVHFAGDWAASWMGFVEGALESAERVVQEILNA